MSYGEAWRLLAILQSDPSSYVAAALAGWEYPVSREDLVTRDLYDLTHQLAWQQAGGKGKKPEAYPRPWPKVTKTTTKPSADLTQDEIIAALRMAGHTAKLPLSVK